MKNKIALILIQVIILGLFNSCKTKETDDIKKAETPAPIERTGITESLPDSTYPLPEAPITQPDALVNPPPEVTPQPPSVAAPSPSPPPATQQKKRSAPKPLGSYQTPLLNRNKERISNINLAIKKVNGYTLKPNETFSFNDVVGKRDAENGFKVATVIVNGDYGEDMGGGICQLSSTLFNAAEKAGLEITERHSHSRIVNYVPQGRDAAVSYGYLDLKFKNNKNHSVQLKAKIENKKLKVYVYKAK